MKALLIIDLQNDFLPEGAIAVDSGPKIIPVINQLMEQFSLIVATKDWHPKTHISFAKTHHKKVGDVIELENGTSQVLWPSHCVQESHGADFSPLLDKEKIHKVFFKGQRLDCDSYSAFFDQSKQVSTGLDDYLKKHHVESLYLVGLTAEYCVKFSALDAKNLGYKVFLIKDGIAFINPAKELKENYFFEMDNLGIKAISSDKLFNH